MSSSSSHDILSDEASVVQRPTLVWNSLHSSHLPGFLIANCFQRKTSHTQSSQSSQSAPLSFLQRVLTRRRSSTPSTPSTFDAHGSLGLNLLSCPSDPLLDLIFVHGLGGGSTKTWSLSKDPTLFWPKAWLPREPGFQNVRIHSYGYDADWTSKKATPTINIYDFGHQLLETLRNSPELAKPRTVGGV